MKAVRLLGNCELEIRQVPEPTLRPGWVVVKMRASAICGSDLHGLYEAPSAATHTPGHEFVGEVVEAGSDSRLRQGARVAVYAMVGCWECEFCRKGAIPLCPQVNCLGFDLDGGDAEFALVPEQCCLPLPDDVSDEVATLAGDVIGVSWQQLRQVGARAQELVVVSGLGPMGLGAVVVAKYLGCQVVGVDTNPYRVELARELGADFA